MKKDAYYEEIKCSELLLASAFEKNTMINSFEKFKTEFLRCIDENNWKCVKKFIKRNVQYSQGVPNYGDQREYAFQEWNQFGGLTKMAKIIRSKLSRSVKEKETRIIFSLEEKNKDETISYYGVFELIDGGWLLSIYVRDSA